MSHGIAVFEVNKVNAFLLAQAFFLFIIIKKSIFYLRISKKSSTFALRLEKHTKLEIIGKPITI